MHSGFSMVAGAQRSLRGAIRSLSSMVRSLKARFPSGVGCRMGARQPGLMRWATSSSSRGASCWKQTWWAFCPGRSECWHSACRPAVLALYSRWQRTASASTMRAYQLSRSFFEGCVLWGIQGCQTMASPARKECTTARSATSLSHAGSGVEAMGRCRRAQWPLLPVQFVQGPPRARTTEPPSTSWSTSVSATHIARPRVLLWNSEKTPPYWSMSVCQGWPPWCSVCTKKPSSWMRTASTPSSLRAVSPAGPW
mmetsp:Transcript_69496/g.224819  ORF Transcript_69496/g.224819 Transcript_69496/m.224819 type:complete len:253 (-) Transcript_69496:405-1163(-)